MCLKCSTKQALSIFNICTHMHILGKGKKLLKKLTELAYIFFAYDFYFIMNILYFHVKKKNPMGSFHELLLYDHGLFVNLG